MVENRLQIYFDHCWCTIFKPTVKHFGIVYDLEYGKRIATGCRHLIFHGYVPLRVHLDQKTLKHCIWLLAANKRSSKKIARFRASIDGTKHTSVRQPTSYGYSFDRSADVLWLIGYTVVFQLWAPRGSVTATWKCCRLRTINVPLFSPHYDVRYSWQDVRAHWRLRMTTTTQANAVSKAAG